MFRTLVVPLDGSELAERALPYAVRLARDGSGKLILVRVAVVTAGIEGADWEQQQIDAVREADSYLTSVAEKVGTRVAVQTKVPQGRAAHQILASIQDLGADGVVMATHGRTGLPHLLYGSVAEAVLASSRVPVFLVYARPGEAPGPPFDPSGARAAVPLDGSSFAEVALQTAVDLVGPTGKLVLVRVVEPSDQIERNDHGGVPTNLDQREDARSQAARDYVVAIARALRQSYPAMDVGVAFRSGDPASTIANAIVDRDADVVVMSTHGRTGLQRAATGSVAGAVLRIGSTPVLLVGPHEAHRSGDVAPFIVHDPAQ